jgi:pimeloyl-[acyl-carrier protein] methyl ester esterase
MKEKTELILIPGWSMDQRIWENMSEKLGAFFDLTFIQCEKVQKASDIPELVSEAVGKTKGPCCILGHSMGALAALETALAFPDKIQNLTLVSGTSCFIQKKAEGYISGWPSRISERMKSNLITQPEKVLSEFDSLLFSSEEKPSPIHRTVDPKVLAIGLDYLIQTDLRSRIGELEMPVLLMHGEEDKICSIGAADWIRKHWRGHSHIIKFNGAGHMPFLTQVEPFLASFKQFWNLEKSYDQ